MTKRAHAARSFVLLLVVCVVSVSEFGCAGGRSGPPAEVPEGVEVRAYEVFGMDCPGCHGGLEKLVNEIAGVETSEANWKEKQLVVTVKPGAALKDQDILDAIRRANLTPGERLR
jgi:copper chaperone CopZ